MFQPQATPFTFNTYGVGLSSPVADFPAAAFQPTSVTDSGPTVFQDPIFNHYNNNNNYNHRHHDNNTQQRHKMAGNGMSGEMEAQEALAREFQSPLEVMIAN
jgi:hypothetical protein